MLEHRELLIDDYLAILRRRYWILVLAAAIASAGVYLYSLTIPNRYTSRAVILIEEQKVSRGVVSSMDTEQLAQRWELMREQILSGSQLLPLVDRFHLFPQGSTEGRLNKLRSAILMTPVQPIVESAWAGMPGFTLSVTLNDAHLAQRVCAEAAAVFLSQNLKWQEQTVQNTAQFLGKQIEDAKNALDEQDAKLAAFKEHYLGQLPDDVQMNLNLSMAANAEFEAVTQSLGRTQQDKINLESQLAQQLASWKSTRAGSNPLTLEEQLANLRSQLLLLRARYTDDYPDVIKLKSDITNLEKRIAEEPETNSAVSPGSKQEDAAEQRDSTSAIAEPPQIRQLRMQIRQYDDSIQAKMQQQQQLQQKIKEYQARVQVSPLVDQQFVELTRDYQTALEFYRGLLTKKAQEGMGADLERNQQEENFRVIDPATLPGAPSYPNRLLFAGGGLGGGLAFGVGILLWLELRDKSIRSERDVEFYLGAATLASVPFVQTTRLRKAALAAFVDTAVKRDGPASGRPEA